MGSGTLTDRSTGQVILDTFFNDIHGALDGDFIGRNASGVATSGQNLGTPAIPWGTIRGGSLVLGGVAIDTTQITSVVNRIISGKKRSTSNQPAFLTPNGAAASFILAGASTNLVVDINGSSTTVSTDITKSSLTTAPSSNNTTLLNDADATGGTMDTRTWGEIDANRALTVDAMGSNISALVGKWAAFKVAGAATEYLLAFVESTTKLSRCYRGFFYDSSLAPINRTTLTDNDVFTLMSLGWVFIQNDGTTVDVSYNNPVWSFTQPTSPSSGDYWYDLGNTEWKRYDGATFQVINRTWIGMVVIDSSNCVAARCVEFHANYNDRMELDLEIQSTSVVRASRQEARVNVAGVDQRFRIQLPTWNMTTDLATAADMISSTEQSSRMYFFYLKDTGATVISDIKPYYRGDLYGHYHPHNPWRCVGAGYNDGSANIISAGKMSLQAGLNTPLVTKYTSGSGTHYRHPKATYIKYIMVGAGGGGGGSGQGSYGDGAAGGNTTFGVSTAGGGGGGGGGSAVAPGAGGSATLGTGPVGIAVAGGNGTGASASSGTASSNIAGAPGGNSILGGGGGGGYRSAAGTAGSANTGGGGGGGGTGVNTSTEGGAGGGAGAGIIAFITPTSSAWADSYSYSVGAAGTAGTAGTNGLAGGAGGSGQIVVIELF